MVQVKHTLTVLNYVTRNTERSMHEKHMEVVNTRFIEICYKNRQICMKWC